MAEMNNIIKQFPEVGEVQEIKALTSGLINQTYLVKTADENEPNYVLQRINNNIFCDVDMLQHNIEVVTNHIRAKLEAAGEEEIDRKVLRYIPAVDGKTYYCDAHDEKIRQILNYLRQINPYGDPAENPETAEGSDYHITFHYSDGCQESFRQKGDRFLQGSDGVWRNIDPKKAMRLGFILGKMRSDPHI